MAYADFGYYANEFYGSAVPEEAFKGAAARASDYIDYVTHGKAARAGDGQYPAVQNCCCALAERIYRENCAADAALSGQEVKSESNGDWSRSYTTGADALNVLAGRERLYDIARRYLASTGLLYCGGGCG